MLKRIYHGSSNIIEQPLYGYGKAYNDYGLGFYCTESLEMAKEWGVSRDKDGYANKYEIECDGLAILDLNDDSLCILHWLAVLLENREFDMPAGLALEAKEYLLSNFSVDYASHDIIVGYRADDSYFSFAQDFLNGTISLRQLANALRLGKLGQQFVLKSEEAFRRIRFLGFEVARTSEWLARKEQRDKAARREYFDVERNRRMRGDLYIPQIIDEEMKADDPRLR
ncbi:DUF3990 domain-containing protein [Arabiibacter massiliensis]|uniref:DUF3990 domain-containing protein n=1 Tax=Arabiibacter massiliensis TaxID=1870985 RepID=UPI0009BB590D|nr:DUF3990 domain-containing protein [Arabiibacter massiliensis]